MQKVMVQPINLIFRYLQNRSRIQVWLYKQCNLRIEGCIVGFDEYMNLVLDDAEEVHIKNKTKKTLRTDLAERRQHHVDTASVSMRTFRTCVCVKRARDSLWTRSFYTFFFWKVNLTILKNSKMSRMVLLSLKSNRFLSSFKGLVFCFPLMCRRCTCYSVMQSSVNDLN